MKHVNFSHSGGFPLEQETLERLQTAYRSELYEALKSHLSIVPGINYLVAPASSAKTGWAVIHQNGEGILYPILKSNPQPYLKTIRTGTNLIYGTGTSQIAYFDYEAKYINQAEFNAAEGVAQNNDAQTVFYYNLAAFEIVKDLKTIETILQSIEANIDAVEANIDVIEANIDAVEANIDVIENFLGKALVDSSTNSETSLTLNLGANWTSTYIGGKVHLNNINTTDSKSLLVLNNQNQITQNNTLINSLIDRLTILENKPATAVPIGMIAIWGKPAPFPEGWEEYVPLRGRIPVGVYNPSPQQRIVEIGQRNYFQDLTFYNNNGVMTWPFETLGNAGGNVAKSLSIDEMPQHSHDLPTDGGGSNNIQSLAGSANSDEGISESSKTGLTGKSQSFSMLNPYRVVHYIEYTGRPSDTTAPTKPTSLVFSNVGNNSAILSWTASSDDSGVTNYIIYRNGTQIETIGNLTSYSATGLSASTTYSFYVVAKDAAGNSTASDPQSVTTTNVIVPQKPEYLNCYLLSEKEIMIEWDFAANSGPAAKYELYRRTSGSALSSLIHETPNLSYIDNNTAYNTSYLYKVRAVYTNGVSDFTTEYAIVTDPRDNSCFDVESLVTMASGRSKKLKNIVVGDILQGFSFPNEIDESEGDYMLWTGKLEEAVKAEVTVVGKRTSTEPNYYEIKTADTTIKVTAEHPLLITQDNENLQWISVKNVTENMSLIDKNGKPKPIESVVFKEETLEVALLDVESVDNYIISGIVAHNNKPLDPVDPQP
ncbi:fibronectin type III domain-containing protein [Flavobacterium reichenbachii]|uniref:Fibronectin type-III domain-containing protein n=1 Tax=Flavobacterium reichenbachii TaxID=362418 RepID=A0A085ZPS7_9FLAO|nr:fibronectin type III domain-containing protein [Flavobacterium reichenbachii]KFF06441.1 hypothetical protein IW19_13370 [Flavobacterium reichenbachii]OXB11884.1 hypothetical protein B0A68_20500 [Flavobacterium reichenbachii]